MGSHNVYSHGRMHKRPNRVGHGPHRFLTVWAAHVGPIWPTRNFDKGQTVSTVDDIRSSVLKLGNARLIFHELLIGLLLTLYYTLPGPSASAERSFSSLRRLKMYLRSRMTATRLNACTA